MPPIETEETTLNKNLLSAETRFQRGTQQLTEKVCKKTLGPLQHLLLEARNVNTWEKQLVASHQQQGLNNDCSRILLNKVWLWVMEVDLRLTGAEPRSQVRRDHAEEQGRGL